MSLRASAVAGRVGRDPGLDRSDIPYPERPARAPWMIFGSILVLATIAFGVANIVSLLAHEEHREHATFPSAGIALVDVENETGSVHIEPTDAATIDIDVDVSEGLGATDVSWEVVGTTLEVRGSCSWYISQWCGSTYVIRVPADVAVRVHTDGGRIVASGREGPVTADSSNGTVELSDISGDVDVRASNGRIDARSLRSASVRASADNGRIGLSFDEAPTVVDARADNGRVDIALPAGSGPYAVDTSADNGSETVDVATDPASARSITAHSDNGSVTIHER